MIDLMNFLSVSLLSRLPLYQGAYGGYIIPLLALMEVDPDKCKIRPSTDLFKGNQFVTPL